MDARLLCSLTLTLFSLVRCYPDGAPLLRCVDMTPGHGVEQTDPNPYSLDVSVNKYVSGTGVMVTISGSEFCGVLIQARKVDTTEIVGTFTDPGAESNLKLLDCSGVSGSAVTHVNINVKQNVTLTWNPPASDQGDIEFTATVLTDAFTWWMNTGSGALSYGEDTNLGDRLEPCLMLLMVSLYFVVNL